MFSNEFNSLQTEESLFALGMQFSEVNVPARGKFETTLQRSQTEDTRWFFKGRCSVGESLFTLQIQGFHRDHSFWMVPLEVPISIEFTHMPHTWDYCSGPRQDSSQMMFLSAIPGFQLAHLWRLAAPYQVCLAPTLCAASRDVHQGASGFKMSNMSSDQ